MGTQEERGMQPQENGGVPGANIPVKEEKKILNNLHLDLREGANTPPRTPPPTYTTLQVPGGGLARRGSKVRFSDTNLAARDEGSAQGSEDDTFGDVSPSESLVIQNSLTKMLARGALAARRGSATPSETGSLGLGASKPRKRLSSKFESLDYTTVESQRFLQEQEKLKPGIIQKAALSRWLVNFLVGIFVAIIAILVYVCIERIAHYKFLALFTLLEDCRETKCLIIPGLVWIIINCVLVFLGSYLVTYHAPQAAGSGIPQIKCYLNGIKIPGLLGMKTLLAKAGGVVLSVTGGLACGKEGPMIHSGSICASCISKGEIKCGKKKMHLKMFEGLDSDQERRDFVSAGAASGVSAAFGAPVGGVLFSLEEGASFLNQMLTWRMLFSSMAATLFLNIVMSAIKGHAQNMSSPGLISFGMMGDIEFRTFELPIFMLMAIIGGLSGALFNYLNYKITLVRRRYVTRNWAKVLEAVFVAGCSAIVAIGLIYGVPDCHLHTSPAPNGNHSNVSNSHLMHKRAVESHQQKLVFGNVTPGNETQYGNYHLASYAGTLGNETQHGDGHETSHGGTLGNETQHGENHDTSHGDGHGFMLQGFCPPGQYNHMAKILFGTPEGGLHAMLHDPKDQWGYSALVIFLVVYFALAVWTYGLMVSSGVFIPSLLLGATWGRIIGMIVMQLTPAAGANIGKYALVGAACQLGGTVRMTLSLTVIVIECTGDITFGIPIMLSLIIAKWMGDYFNPGIYDLHIEIMGIPLLPWEPPEMCYTVKAKEVMSKPVEVLRTIERIGRIVDLLKDSEHNGFPVVEDIDTVDSRKNGTYGRCKGFILRSQLQQILYEETGEVSEDELKSRIDLRMHMDNSPYTINENVSLPRIFKLFRGLGLRHLVAVNDKNEVVGVVTRKDLAKYREETTRGHFKIEKLEIEEC